jgi:hypothetical protein
MSWAFDERPMDGVEELNCGADVSLVDLPGSQLAIRAATDTGEALLIDLTSLIAWFHAHRPDLLSP